MTHTFVYTLLHQPKLIYTMRVNDRRLSEGEIKFYTSKYGRPPTGRRAKLREQSFLVRQLFWEITVYN